LRLVDDFENASFSLFMDLSFFPGISARSVALRCATRMIAL
jgi:hypothetical protein